MGDSGMVASAKQRLETAITGGVYSARPHVRHIYQTHIWK